VRCASPAPPRCLHRAQPTPRGSRPSAHEGGLQNASGDPSTRARSRAGRLRRFTPPESHRVASMRARRQSLAESAARRAILALRELHAQGLVAHGWSGARRLGSYPRTPSSRSPVGPIVSNVAFDENCRCALNTPSVAGSSATLTTAVPCGATVGNGETRVKTPSVSTLPVTTRGSSPPRSRDRIRLQT